MAEKWFSGFADELAQCLLDAERCAEACEASLETVRNTDDAELRTIVVQALVAPAAIARVLSEFPDESANLVLAICHLCRDVTTAAAEQLDALGTRIDGTDTIAALLALAGSCGRLLEAA